MKEKISYSFSLLLIAAAILIYYYPDFIFGTTPRTNLVSGTVLYLGELFFSILLGLAGIILLIITMLQGKIEASKSVQQSVLYKSLNPVALLFLGTLLFLVVYFEIGIDYFGGKLLFYLGLGSGLLFFVGLAGFLHKFFSHDS